MGDEYPKIKDTRPRMLADISRLEWLKANKETNLECRSTYSDIKEAYYGWWVNDSVLFVDGTDSSKWRWDWSNFYASQQVMLSLIIYKLDSSAIESKRLKFVAKHYIQYLDTLDFDKLEYYDEENILRQMTDAGDLMLDWCYNDFDDALKAALANTIFKVANRFMHRFIYSTAGNSYVSSHNTYNTVLCHQNALILYKCPELSSEQRDTVNFWYMALMDKFTNGFFPCWEYYRNETGLWNWGSAYSFWGYLDQFQFFENMKIATGKNYYYDLNWIKNSINQYLYFICPDDMCIHLGDGQTQLVADRVIYLHSKYFDDERSNFLVNKYSSSKYMTSTFQRFMKFLYKDFRKKYVDTLPNLNKYIHSNTVGLSVCRNSWNELTKNDSESYQSNEMITFFNSPSKRAAHEHRDNNNFTVFYKKPLIIESGYYDSYGSEHFNNYYTRSIAHNTICVFDSLEKFYNFGSAVSNDGGQIESIPLMNYDDISKPQNQRGKWLNFCADDSLCYNVADAALSYDSNKVKLFVRKLLYHNPHKIVILDNLILKDTKTKQRDVSWLIHSVNKPIIDASDVNIIVDNHIEKYFTNSFIIENGNANALIYNISPKNSYVQIIGGSGYEFWVNGKNYPPNAMPTNPKLTTGNWRAEVKPQTVQDTMMFLNIISLNDAPQTLDLSKIQSVENSISTGLLWGENFYIFSSGGKTNVDYHYVDNLKEILVDQVIVQDLSPGNYEMYINGKRLSTEINALPNKCVSYKLSENTAISKIEIKLKRDNIDYKVNAAFYVRIVPVSNEVIILTEENINKYYIKIFDNLGKLRGKYENTSSINVSFLESGIYFIEIHYDNKTYYYKIIKK